MKKQFHIEFTGKNGLVVDLSENDIINLRVSYSATQYRQVGTTPAKYRKKDTSTPDVQVDGFMGVDEQSFQVSWADHKLEIGDEILIKYIESDKTPTTPTTEKRYIEPEASCSFCKKTKSEVNYLLQCGSITHTCICNECVELSAKVIAEQESTT